MPKPGTQGTQTAQGQNTPKKEHFWQRWTQKGKGAQQTAAALATMMTNAAPAAAQTVRDTTPPAYTKIAARYATVKEGVDKIGRSKKKHMEGEHLATLTKEKEKVDKEYEVAFKKEIPESKAKDKDVRAQEERRRQELQRQKDAMQTKKEETDSALETVTGKVSKNIAAKEKLKTYEGKLLPKVIRHASELSTGDELVKTDDASLSEEEKQDKKKLTIERAEKKKKFKKQDKEAGVFEKTGLARTVALHGATIAGAISDGVSQFKFPDREAIEKFDKYKWFDGATDVGSALSILAAVEATGSFVKSCIDTHRRNKSETVDDQERWQDARLILGKISDLFSALIGAAAPYTALVPVLGPILNIADSLLQCIVGGMNLFTNVYHKHKMSGERARIWQVIAERREKYKKKGDTESAGYYNMDGIGATGLFKRSRQWSQADAKRKQLQETVANQVYANGARPAEFQASSMETGISGRLSQLRQDKHDSKLSSEEEKTYRRNKHAMEALQLMSHYRTVEKAEKKMTKAIVLGAEGLATNTVKIVGNAALLGGTITANPAAAGAGVGINITEGGYEVARFVGSQIYKKIREAYGSQARKEETREQMAEHLFDRMVSLGPGKQKWSGEFFSLDDVEDYKIREYRAGMDELDTTIRRGLDARASTLLSAPTGKDMKAALAAAFSQDGGVSFGAEG